MKNEKKKGLAKWIWILIIILILVFGLLYIVFTGEEGEKVIDLRNLPGPPAPELPATGLVTFPGAPNTPGLPPDEGEKCVSVDYNSWSECGENGKQTKTILSKSPEDCFVESPVLDQACDYIFDCKEEDWIFSLSPSTCPSSGEQTKTWNKIGQCRNGVQKLDSEIVSCDQIIACTLVIYSEWEVCGNNNVRTRTIFSKTPVDCVIDNPILLEQCQYVPECTEENWVYVLDPLECPSSEQQTKTWSVEGTCRGGIQKPLSETVSCNYQSSQCIYVFSEWGDCKPGNIQTRTIVSEGPQGCQGNPLLEETCGYVSSCTPDQIVQCNEVENGIATGYKDKCNPEGTTLLDEDTCTFSCNGGYDKVFGKCISKQVIADYKVELGQVELKLEEIEEDLILKKKEDNKKLISIADLALGDLDISNLIIKRSSLTEPKEFIIVKGLSLVDKTKTIYLEKKDLDSNGVCIKDSEGIENIEGILDGCTKINCPSTGEYSCVVEENTFIVSNLRYSGVVEDKLFCGDNVCLGDESCSSCPGDCGECPAQRSSGGGGGGGSSTRSIPLNDTQNVTRDIEDDTITIVEPKDTEEPQITEELKKNWKFWILIFILTLAIIIVLIVLLLVFLRRKNQEMGIKFKKTKLKRTENIYGISKEQRKKL